MRVQSSPGAHGVHTSSAVARAWSSLHSHTVAALSRYSSRSGSGQGGLGATLTCVCASSAKATVVYSLVSLSTASVMVWSGDPSPTTNATSTRAGNRLALLPPAAMASAPRTASGVGTVVEPAVRGTRTAVTATSASTAPVCSASSARSSTTVAFIGTPRRAAARRSTLMCTERRVCAYAGSASACTSTWKRS